MGTKFEIDIPYGREQRMLHILFFLFGFGIMAWVPRFPEVRANLRLDNGAFGSIMSTGSIGALIGLLTVGHIIHRIGVKRVTVVSIVILYASLISLVYISSIAPFLIFNMAFGFGITAIHVAITSQGFNFDKRSGKNITISSAGYWSAGALFSAIAAGFLVDRVSLATHITLLSIFLGIAMIVIVIALHPVLLTANTNRENDYSIKEIFTSFRIDWPVSLGWACAVYLEFAVGDWGAIFTKDRLEVSAGLSTVPYIVFTATMIFGRLLIHKLLPHAPIETWVKRAALLGGLGFGSSIIIATHLPADMKWWSYWIFILGFGLGGLGSSFVAPSFFRAATRRSSLPNAIVVGQFGAINNLLIFIIKWIVAWTMQLTGSIALAMMIPTVMLLGTIYYANAVKENPTA
jgi:MFS family permease